MKDKNIGSPFDSLLEETGELAEVQARVSARLRPCPGCGKRVPKTCGPYCTESCAKWDTEQTPSLDP